MPELTTSRELLNACQDMHAKNISVAFLQWQRDQHANHLLRWNRKDGWFYAFSPDPFEIGTDSDLYDYFISLL